MPAVPFLADLIVALVAGSLAFLGARWYSGSEAVPDQPAREVARAVGSAVRPQRGLRRLVTARLDRSVTTGLLLTLALGATLLGGIVLGVLAVLVRRVASIQHVDNSVADWGYRHRSAGSTSALHVVTDLGKHPARRHLRARPRRGRAHPKAKPLDVPLRARRARRRGGGDARGQGARRPRQADADHRGGDARPVVPERAFGDSCRVLRRRRARPRAQVAPPRPTSDHRGRGRRHDRGRSKPRAARLCTGSRTWSADWRSAGPGSRSAQSPSAAACCVPTAAVDTAAAEAAAPKRTPDPHRGPQSMKTKEKRDAWRRLPPAERLLNRELSSLALVDRVLQLASDPEQPLLERVRFCSIVSTILDELFMIRVAGLLDQVESGLMVRSADGRLPRETLAEIREGVLVDRPSTVEALDTRPSPGARRGGHRRRIDRRPVEEAPRRARATVQPRDLPRA